MNSLNIHDYYQADELNALNELGISPYDLIFTARPILPFFKTRQFVCHLQFKDGLYVFALPPKLPRRFKKQIELTEKKLLATNNAHIRKLMAGAKKNAEFVERFNSELFFKHSFHKGNKLLAGELFELYASPPYNQAIDLSADADKQAFIALYAMTFYACSPEDIFTVDGIFSVQPERHADNAKKTAGNAVFNLLVRGKTTEIEQVLLTMSKTILALTPPRVNLADMEMLSKNYTLFRGMSELGRVFFKFAKSSNAAEAANQLAKYAAVAQLCDVIAGIGDSEDYRRIKEYGECVRLGFV
jgi:hypothetical protein